MSGTSPPTKSVVGSPYSPSAGFASRDHAMTFPARPFASSVAVLQSRDPHMERLLGLDRAAKSSSCHASRWIVTVRSSPEPSVHHSPPPTCSVHCNGATGGCARRLTDARMQHRPTYFILAMPKLTIRFDTDMGRAILQQGQLGDKDETDHSCCRCSRCGALTSDGRRRNRRAACCFGL